MDIENIKASIAELAGRRRNVTMAEIVRIVDALGEDFEVRRRKATHGFLFVIGGQRFMVNAHNRGNKQVKSYSVDAFLDAMAELGLYEE